MRAEYDLVVIGDSLSSRRAALWAARHYARVAFVQHSQIGVLARPVIFQELADLISQSVTQELPFPFSAVTDLRRWIMDRAAALQKPYSLNRLAHHGVDVLSTPGSFIASSPRTRYPLFESDGRQFRSRFYLLGLDPEICAVSNPRSTEIDSLEDFLLQLEALPCGEQIWIHVRYPWAILLGLILKKLGFAITLFGDDSILSREDPDVAFFLQCQLESEGLVIQMGSAFSPTHDSAVVFKPVYRFPLTELSLQHLGVEYAQSDDSWVPSVIVNPKLETSQACLSAYGPVIGGYSLPRMADYEASIALGNLLFQAHQSLYYEQLAYSLPLVPGFARIGLTEPQARQQFSNVEIMTRSLDYSGPNDGGLVFCKLIAQSSGSIVGIHWIGDGARDGLEVFETIVRQGLKVTDLGNCSVGSISLQIVFEDFAHRWDEVRSPRKRDRLEQYFRAKRKQFS